ncbi:MAG TPA: DNA translocase FtsK 4TM domain-containing protein, partial [Geobacterales bacterium]|nr:DNA translocase FtsK 4TM domain-containing protein [Geobacterales bacterium]
MAVEESHSDDKRQRLKAEILGLSLAAVGLFITLALLSFHGSDPSLNSESTGSAIGNLGGVVGSYLADLLLQGFGVAAYLVPATMAAIAYQLIRFQKLSWSRWRWLALSLLLFTLATLFAFNLEQTTLLGQSVPTGGMVGIVAARFLKTYLGVVGALLVLATLLVASVMVVARLSIAQSTSDSLSLLNRLRELLRERTEQPRETIKSDKPAVTAPVRVTIEPPTPVVKAKKGKPAPAAVSGEPAAEEFIFKAPTGDFQLPPLTLLDPPPAESGVVDEELLAANARTL